MPLTVTDERLAQTGLTAEELRLEIAVTLRDQNRLTYRQAADWAGLSPGEMIDLLRERGVPWIHIGGTTQEEAEEYIRGDAVLGTLWETKRRGTAPARNPVEASSVGLPP